MTTTSRGVVWTGRVLSALVSIAFLMSAVGKFVGGESVQQGFAHLGLPTSMILPLAILEFSCAVIYLVPRTATLGAILLAGYMGGAICTHWRVGEAPILQILLGVCAWLGLWLREGRLRPLLPLRS